MTGYHRLGGFNQFLFANSRLLAGPSLGLFCVCVLVLPLVSSSSYKDTRPIGLGPHPYVFIYL